jgi:hypothetical protein
MSSFGSHTRLEPTPVHAYGQGASLVACRSKRVMTAPVSATSVSAHLELLGPQRSGESGLPARVRFHQSWFRYDVLGLRAFGSTRHHSGGRPLGSILAPSDARNGLNFVTPSARSLFEWRHQQGWGVDPFRCTSHMTSSQALMFNLLGPLWPDHSWITRLLTRLLEAEVFAILGLDLEFAPLRRSAYLRDMTRLDGWIRLDTNDGPTALVVEVKYSDRFSSRYINPAEQAPYRALASRTQLWSLDDGAAQARQVNQLLRCHALGAAVWLSEQPNCAPPRLLVVHHPDDDVARKTVAAYRKVLRIPELVTSVGLDAFLAGMLATASSCSQRHVVEELGRRYVAHDLSEELWHEYRAAAHKELPARGDRW